MTAIERPDGCNGVAKALHWAIFVLFLVMYVLGFGLMASDGDTALGAQWGPVFDWHATLSLLILILAVVRLWWRSQAPLPD